MARTLPWAKSSEASTSTPRRKAAAKQHKRESSASSSSEDEGTSKQPPRPVQSTIDSPATPTKKRCSRSPSSSPICGPPPATTMHSGYSADDIYVMVEDELQTVAQTFTRHLHAAEYKRLKKKAREAPPHAPGMLPRLSPSAPKDVKRKFEVMALREKQESVLGEDGEEKAKDPWLGTSLAGLMGNSSRPKKALLGSQEIQSTTRAANGFGVRNSESPSKQAKTGLLHFSLESKLHKPEKAEGNGCKARSNTTELAAVPHKTPLASKNNSSKSKLDLAVEESVTKAIATNAKITEARHKLAARPPRKKFSFNDDFSMESISSPAPHQTFTQPTTKRKVKAEVKEESRTKTKLNDIPMFLV